MYKKLNILLISGIILLGIGLLINPFYSRAANNLSGLVKKGNTVYQVIGSTLRPVPSLKVFKFQGFQWKNVKTVSDLSGYTIGASLSDKTDKLKLVKLGNTVYLVEGKIKRAFASLSAFQSFGSPWSAVSSIAQSYLDSLQDGGIIRADDVPVPTTPSRIIHKGDELVLDGKDKIIYRNNKDGSKQEIGSLALDTVIIDKFEKLDTQKISDQEYLYAETDLTKKPYRTVLNLRNSKTGDLIKTIQTWDYGTGSGGGTGKINFIKHNTDNQKVYFIMDMPQGSDYNWYPLLNYNIKTGQLEGNSKYGVSGHSQLDLPIYFSPTAKKLIYEEESTVTYGGLKIEGLGVNIAHIITNTSLGLGSQEIADFSCLAWITDESKAMFKAVQIITATNKKDLGYFIYDLNSKEIVPIEGGVCLGK